VFAEGQRIDEIPLAPPQPADHICDGVRAVLLVPIKRRDRRRMFRRLPYCAVPGYAPICLDSNDPETVACGFKQRLARVVPPADPELLKEFSKFCSLEASKLPSLLPMTFEEWLENTNYNENRKNQLREAFERNHGSPPERTRAQRISAFVKTEFYTALKHCRWIASRADCFKVFAGPAAKTVESVIYQLPWFIKHTPVPDRPAAVASLRQAGRRYYLTDFTAFESHFVPEVMTACEAVFYKHILKDWEHVDFMISILTGKNKLRTPLGVTAELIGRRMSGEMFTSVGNGITNLMLAKFLANRQGHELYGFVEGDDGLFATEATLTQEMYRDLGFTIKIVEVDDPCRAIPLTPGVEAGSMAFCGLIFSDAGEIIKDYRKFFQGFGWTHSFITAGDRIMLQLLRAKALSTIYETPQCPIIGAMARYALGQTRDVAISKTVRSAFDEWHYVPKDEIPIPIFNPDTTTRDLYSRVFGIPESVQLVVEQAIEQGDFDRVAQLLPAPSVSATFADRYVVVT